MLFRHRFPIALLAFAALVCVLSIPAASESDRTKVGHNITVAADEHVGDVTCFGCSIHVRGQVSGDLTAFGGSIVLEDQALVSGDATSFGGDIRLDRQVAVNGDVTALGGHVRRDSSASVGGSVTDMGGGRWILLIFCAPFIVFALFVWFVIWVVRRFTQRAVPAPV